MNFDWKDEIDNLTPLLDTIIKVIPPPKQRDGVPRMKITSLDFSSFTGRIAIGRIYQGGLKEGQSIGVTKADGSVKRGRIKELHVFEGLGKRKVDDRLPFRICRLEGKVLWHF